MVQRRVSKWIVSILLVFFFSYIPLDSVNADSKSDVTYEETLILIDRYDDFEIKVEVYKGDIIEYDWTSDYDIKFEIDNGGWGDSSVYLIQDHANGTLTVPKNNTYTISFESRERDVNTTVDYEIKVIRKNSGTPIEDDDNETQSNDSSNRGLIIGLALGITFLIIILIIIVVLLVFRKKKPDEPSQY